MTTRMAGDSQEPTRRPARRWGRPTAALAASPPSTMLASFAWGLYAYGEGGDRGSGVMAAVGVVVMVVVAVMVGPWLVVRYPTGEGVDHGRSRWMRYAAVVARSRPFPMFSVLALALFAYVEGRDRDIVVWEIAGAVGLGAFVVVIGPWCLARYVTADDRD